MGRKSKVSNERIKKILSLNPGISDTDAGNLVGLKSSTFGARRRKLGIRKKRGKKAKKAAPKPVTIKPATPTPKRDMSSAAMRKRINQRVRAEIRSPEGQIQQKEIFENAIARMLKSPKIKQDTMNDIRRAWMRDDKKGLRQFKSEVRNYQRQISKRHPDYKEISNIIEFTDNLMAQLPVAGRRPDWV